MNSEAGGTLRFQNRAQNETLDSGRRRPLQSAAVIVAIVLNQAACSKLDTTVDYNSCFLVHSILVVQVVKA